MGVWPRGRAGYGGCSLPGSWEKAVEVLRLPQVGAEARWQGTTPAEHRGTGKTRKSQEPGFVGTRGPLRETKRGCLEQEREGR